MIARTSAKLIAGALAASALFVSAYAGQPTELKRDIETCGSAITLADLFVDAGSAGGRAVAPAPRPGQSTNISARFVSAAAAAAGLTWTPAAGMEQISVSCRGGGAARRQYAALTTVQTDAQPAAAPIADAVVHRGDLVTLVYLAPGLQLTTRAKALADAGMGGPVRLVNLQSNRTVDAVVTGPDAASASPGQSF